VEPRFEHPLMIITAAKKIGKADGPGYLIITSPF